MLFPKLGGLQKFHYVDNRFDGNLNYSALIPFLFEAINKTINLFDFAWEGRNGLGWGDEEAELFANYMQSGRGNIQSLSLANNKIGPRGMQVIALALPKIKSTKLYFGNNAVGSGIITLANYFPFTSFPKAYQYTLVFDNNN